MNEIGRDVRLSGHVLASAGLGLRSHVLATSTQSLGLGDEGHGRRANITILDELIP